jgi:hypothetical protein
MVDMSQQDKTYEDLSRDRTVLIDYLEIAEKDKARLISKYEGIISNLELQVEELSAPRFTKMDAAEAEEMMVTKTWIARVTDAYRENPFWDQEDAIELDFLGELVILMDDITGADPEIAHSSADDLLLTALNHYGCEELVTAYNELRGRCSWWACA